MNKSAVALHSETPGEAIDRLAREQGRTKWWVAKELGTHPSHLSKLISGERPITERVAIRLASVFDVPVSTFLPEAE
jgi:plasmid maintenance system antidote protein VapI